MTIPLFSGLTWIDLPLECRCYHVNKPRFRLHPASILYLVSDIECRCILGGFRTAKCFAEFFHQGDREKVPLESWLLEPWLIYLVINYPHTNLVLTLSPDDQERLEFWYIRLEILRQELGLPVSAQCDRSTTVISSAQVWRRRSRIANIAFYFDVVLLCIVIPSPNIFECVINVKHKMEPVLTTHILVLFSGRTWYSLSNSRVNDWIKRPESLTCVLDWVKWVRRNVVFIMFF